VRLGEADLRLMIALSEQIGIAVGRARLFAEARANADNLATAQRIAHLGSWEDDGTRDGVRWSDEVFRILGYAPQAFVPTPQWIQTVMHPDDRERVGRPQRAQGVEGTPDDHDYRIVGPDGEVRGGHPQAGRSGWSTSRRRMSATRPAGW
jgi:PAS domain-containing protein